MPSTTMEPLKYLLPYNDQKLALLVLNCPLEDCKQKLEVLWQKAVVKIGVDGAANHLYELVKNGASYVPDIITGDFDSAKKHVLEYFETKGTEIVETPDQNRTDFTKGLNYMLSKDMYNYDIIVVIGGLMDARVDHFFGNINTLFLAAKETDKTVYFVYEDSVTVLLQPGKHTINVNTGLEGDWCGLIPVRQPCRDITTSGLKWNLDHGTLEFGSLISTSNTWDGSDVVTIETSDAVLWTMGIKKY